VTTPTFVRGGNLVGAVDSATVSGNIDTTGAGSSPALVVFINAGHVAGNMTGKAFSTPTLGGSTTGWTEQIAETICAPGTTGMMGAWVCLNPASSASISLALAWTTSVGIGDRIAACWALYSDVSANGTAFTVDNDGGSSTSDTMTNAPAAGNLTVGSWSHGSAISSVTTGTLRGTINNAYTDYANGCLAFIEGSTIAFSSASSDTNVGMQVELVATGAAGDATPGPSSPGVGVVGLFGPIAFQWVQQWGIDAVAAGADINVVASCTLASMCMGVVTADRTDTSDADIAVGSSGAVTRDLTAVSDEDVATKVVGTVTRDAAYLADVDVAVGGSGVVTRDLTAVSDEDVAVGGTGVISGVGDIAVFARAGAAVGGTGTVSTGLAVVATEAAAVAATATITRTTTIIATEAVAVGGTGAVTHGLTAIGTEAVAVGGTGVLTPANDVAVFARAGLAVGGTGVTTTGLTVVAVESVGVGGQGLVAHSLTAGARLDAATGVTANIAIGLALTAMLRAAVGGTGSLPGAALPPLVPPFAALITAYESWTVADYEATTRTTVTVTSTVNTTARTSTVNTTAEGTTG